MRVCPSGRITLTPISLRASSKGQAFEASAAADLLQLPVDATDGSHAWHLYIVRLRLERLTIDRAEVMVALRDAGIGASVHFIPLHLHPYYKRRGWAPGDLPVATREYERAFSLPIWPGMTDADVTRVTDAVIGIVGGRRLRVSRRG